MGDHVSTIDTWILYKAGECIPKPVIFLMQVLEKKYYVNFDIEKEIEREYKSCISTLQSQNQPGTELIIKWFVKVVSKSARIHTGKLPKNHEHHLSRLKFDKTDFKFVSVCHRGNSKILVAEESDYNDRIKEYLETRMGISVFSVAEALSMNGMR
jgi:hypothetical protein